MSTLSRTFVTFLGLLIFLSVGRWGASANVANISILAAHEYGHDPQGTITTWKQERSSLDTRTWHYGYDAATRLTSAILKNPAETILKTHGWQFDPGDNRIATQTDVAGLIPTRHNKLNQLLTHGSGPTRFAGTLDEPGTVKVNGQEAKMRNHTLFEAYLELPSGTHEIEIAATDFSENTTTQSFEVEIADEPETQFEYDLNGNLTKITTATGSTNYEWDALNRLIVIIYPDTCRSEFTYDGLSRRVRIVEKDATNTVTSDKRHLWDDLQIAEERATNGSTVKKRFYGHGVELVTGPDSGTYTYRRDHLGSIREVVSSSGTLAARYDYSAWGEVTEAPVAFDIYDDPIYGTFDIDFRYTGHYFHQSSELHLAPFRAYDAQLGRWLSADPIGEAGGMNLYAYVENDPVNASDELGLQRGPGRIIQGPGSRVGRLGSPTNPFVFPRGAGPPRTSPFAWPRKGTERCNQINNMQRTMEYAQGNQGNQRVYTHGEVLYMAMRWLGPGARVTRRGDGMISADGTRFWRPPTSKDSAYANTGIQSNFQRRDPNNGATLSNYHVNVACE
ncbi:MAG: RHS repeat-associated core domain-containing protein [Akkermansiaceae bacterium]